MEIERLIKSIQEYFTHQEDVTTVYLFGSFAQGRERPTSDVDIAVLFSSDLDSYAALLRQLDLANELESLLKRSVDVINLEAVKPILIHQILLNKRLIVDKDLNRRVKFEVEHRREYFDLLPFYRLYHEQALKRLGEDS